MRVNSKKVELQKMKKQGGGSRDFGILASIKKYKNITKRYKVMCDMVAEPDGKAWWVNAWLRGNPPIPGQGK